MLICNADFRHLYVPLVEMGYSRTTASVAVFFVSAFFHEYLVSVPLRTFKTWAFMGMMGQVGYFNTYIELGIYRLPTVRESNMFCVLVTVCLKKVFTIIVHIYK
jgi:hypothetical protein